MFCELWAVQWEVGRREEERYWALMEVLNVSAKLNGNGKGEKREEGQRAGRTEMFKRRKVFL